MDRNVLLAAKAAELNQSLQKWAKDNLAAGEQLLVSLRIQDVSAAIIDVEDFTTSKHKLLGMKVLDYFAQERPTESPHERKLLTRIRNFVAYNYNTLSLGQFVEEVSEYDLLNGPNVGRASLSMILKILKEDELVLKKR